MENLESQVYENLEKNQMVKSLMKNVLISRLITIGPVSYTHLDVYKRQTFGAAHLLTNLQLFLTAMKKIGLLSQV